MNFILENLDLISAGVFALISLFAGVKWSKWKKVAKLIVDAVQDNKVTQKEVEEIVKAIKDKEGI